MKTCRIAIMAKAPVAGLAKTRLAPVLGEAGAAALAARMLAHAVVQAAAADLGPVTVWATPDTSHPAFSQAQRVLAITRLVNLHVGEGSSDPVAQRLAHRVVVADDQHGHGVVLRFFQDRIGKDHADSVAAPCAPHSQALAYTRVGWLPTPGRVRRTPAR